MQKCCGTWEKRSPCTPRKQDKVLLQKIIASETRNMPCLCAEVELENIPCGLKPPFTLEKLCSSSAQPWWRPTVECADARKMSIRVFIPVECLIKDCSGKCVYVQGVLSTTEAISRCLCPDNSFKQQLIIVPCLRLLEAQTLCGEKVLKVKVDICLEMYLIAKEPCGMRKTPPPCPDKPLYPEMQAHCCEKKTFSSPFVRW